MIKNISQIEFKIDERRYQFLCDIDTPLDEVHNALIVMKEIISKKIERLEEKNQDG